MAPILTGTISGMLCALVVLISGWGWGVAFLTYVITGVLATLGDAIWIVYGRAYLGRRRAVSHEDEQGKLGILSRLTGANKRKRAVGSSSRGSNGEGGGCD
ncbi:hypothetical protein [Paracoccus aminophilus]|uniref:Uncharacterized protein n=1 Tax=Paracoccus aminophilus JCM 7686 TaxID=1367847 RepID=S5XM19_PARAH|nr:hypothetical protein [Paracoccus aminophilus]AGT08319.1 hypothetical protein JCM7686_1210 [Paracoccus aminophilus JCM 7686]